MPVPRFTPRSYLNAAQVHLGLARQMLLQVQPQYFIAHYFAGIADERHISFIFSYTPDEYDQLHAG